jgi:hypothetical protein
MPEYTTLQHQFTEKVVKSSKIFPGHLFLPGHSDDSARSCMMPLAASPVIQHPTFIIRHLAQSTTELYIRLCGAKACLPEVRRQGTASFNTPHPSFITGYSKKSIILIG